VFVRVVRFTDTNRERIESLLTRVREAGGPPPGVKAKSIQILLDESRGTAVVLQNFESAEDMESAAKVFDAMEPGETPGTRASVDSCEQMLELSAS